MPADKKPKKAEPASESAQQLERFRCMSGLAPVAKPIQGGPVELPASDLALIWLLSWFCDTDAEVDLAVTVPSATRLATPRLPHWVKIHRQPGRTHVEVGWNPPGPRASAYLKIAQSLEKAPSGTTIEFLSAANPEEDYEYESDAELKTREAGRQRHLGTLSDRGTFLLSHSSIPGKPADFLAAMEIARKITESRPTFEVPSEEDARAVVELARKTAWFADEKALPRVKGKAVATAKGQAMTTAMMVFRRRFARGPWETMAVQERDEAGNREWDEMIDQVGQKVGEALAAPPGDDIILRTERAVFRRADWSKMNVGLLDAIAFAWGKALGEDEPQPQAPADKLTPIDQALSKLGFTSLGAVHVDRFGELYLNAYAGPKGDAFGCVIAGTFGQFEYEFVSHLSNGGSLTTSTTAGLKDQKKKKIYKRSFPDFKPSSLYRKHRAALAQLTTEKVRPVPLDATLEGFCRAVDDYIRREF